MNILQDIVETFDYEILFELFQQRGGVSDTVWTVFSLLGNGAFIWITLAGALLCFRKTRRAGVAICLSLIGCLIVGNLFLKPRIMRPRPFVTHPELTALLRPGDPWSFPSGHTMTGFASATALSRFYLLSSILTYLLAGAIAFSRLYACVHYPTDVAAGVVLGIICGLPTGWLADHLVDLFSEIHPGKGKK